MVAKVRFLHVIKSTNMLQNTARAVHAVQCSINRVK